MIGDMYYGLSQKDGISFRDISVVLSDLDIELNLETQGLPTRYTHYLLSSRIIIPANERARVRNSLGLPKTKGASDFYYALHDWDPTIIKERLSYTSIDNFLSITFRNNLIVERTGIWYKRER